MTKTEEAELAELNLTPKQMEERRDKIAQMFNGEATTSLVTHPDLLDVHLTTLGSCPVCNAPAIFKDRNRLANCGHVRRSHGKLVLRDEKPEQQEPQQSGCISAAQAARLRDLIDTKQSRLAELDAINEQQAHALGAVDAAEAALSNYLLELQGKKTD